MSSTSAIKSKSTMYLNEDHFPTNQGNIVRFLRSLVLSKTANNNGIFHQGSGKSGRVFGRDLKLHLAETRQESKLLSAIYERNCHATL